MADPTYTPPEVWSADTESGGRFANINRPTSGAREEKALPEGKNPFQLHSLATPNGVKVTVMLEELLEKGHSGAEYDAYTVNIGEGQQFTSGFVDINPNSKIPALVDKSGDTPFRIFESGAILVHLAEKFGEFLPTDPAARAEVLSWVFWQVGTGPFIGGGFGHFYAYAPEKYEYPINRYAMETKRIFDVADKRLAETRFLAGDDYTIADMANFPWLAPFVFGTIYNEAKTFLSIHEYQNVARWVHEIAARPAVKRGRIVNKVWGDEDSQLA
ncbi:MAG: glutathione-dependent disulfide-bond oxidoreductase, partial [Pseudomonadota bacterium]